MTKEVKHEVANYLSFPATISDPSQAIDGFEISQIVATVESMEPILMGLDLRAELKKLRPDVGQQAFLVPIYSTSPQAVIDGEGMDMLQSRLDTLCAALVDPEQVVMDGNYQHNSRSDTQRARKRLKLAEAVAKALNGRQCHFRILTSALQPKGKYKLQPQKATVYKDAQSRLNPPAEDVTLIVACAVGAPIGQHYFATLDGELVQCETLMVADSLASGDSHHYVARKRKHSIQVYELIRLATDGELPVESGDLLD